MTHWQHLRGNKASRLSRHAGFLPLAFISVARAATPFTEPPMPVIPARISTVTSFSASGDGKTMNTVAFARAIAACENAGGGSAVTSGDLRMGKDYNFPGFPQALVNLGDNVFAYYIGILSPGAGTTVEIGDLSGTSSSGLQGGPTVGRALTYRIGGRGGVATYSGSIGEQAAGNTTAIVKTGAGMWTLAGACTYVGSTTIEQGTLRVSGSTTNTAPVKIMNGATLTPLGGTLNVDSVTLDLGATFTGYGTIVGELLNNSTVTSNSGGTLTFTDSAVTGGKGFYRVQITP